METPLVYLFDFFMLVISFATGFALYRSLERDLRVVFYFVSVFVWLSIIQYCLSLIPLNNLWTIHVATLSEYSFFIYLLSLWQKKPKLARIYKASIPIFSLFWLIGLFTFNPYDKFDSITSGVSSILIVFATCNILMQVFLEDSLSVWRDKRLFVLIGMLVFFAPKFLIASFSNIILQLIKDRFDDFWIILIWVNIFLYVCITSAFVLEYWEKHKPSARRTAKSYEEYYQRVIKPYLDEIAREHDLQKRKKPPTEPSER